MISYSYTTSLGFPNRNRIIKNSNMNVEQVRGLPFLKMSIRLGWGFLSVSNYFEVISYFSREPIVANFIVINGQLYKSNTKNYTKCAGKSFVSKKIPRFNDKRKILIASCRKLINLAKTK